MRGAIEEQRKESYILALQAYLSRIGMEGVGISGQE